MFSGMYEVGDSFRTVSLKQHIKDLIAWRRKETNQDTIDKINKELTKCYDEKYNGGF